MLGYQPGSINFFASGSSYDSECFIEVDSRLAFKVNEQYYGYTSSYIDTAEAFSFFTDTITIPLISQVKPNQKELPEGSFVHIVKNQGITDFSTDGETVWRRIY